MAVIRKLLCFFGRFCCGGATKEEDAVLEQQPSSPGLVNLFSQDSWSNVKVPMDPWRYGGLLMAPSNGRPVFGYFNNGFFNVVVVPSSNEEPRHGQPVFGKGKWWGAPLEAADTRKYRVVGGLGLEGLVLIWSDENSLYPESSYSEDEADAGCQLSRKVSCGDLRRDPRVELKRTKSLLAVFPKDFKVGVFFY